MAQDISGLSEADAECAAAGRFRGECDGDCHNKKRRRKQRERAYS